jgi:hypothetical protein
VRWVNGGQTGNLTKTGLIKSKKIITHLYFSDSKIWIDKYSGIISKMKEFFFIKYFSKLKKKIFVCKTHFKNAINK